MVYFSQFTTPYWPYLLWPSRKPLAKFESVLSPATLLTAVLDTHQYPLPVSEDPFAKLKGGNCFAKLDVSDAYFQI